MIIKKIIKFLSFEVFNLKKSIKRVLYKWGILKPRLEQGLDEAKWLDSIGLSLEQFESGFKDFNENWRTGQPWGMIHPEYQYQWYDPEMVIWDGEKLILRSRLKLAKAGTVVMGGLTGEPPKMNTEDSTIAIGLVTSKRPFNPGHFHFEIEIPLDKWAWPAVWTTCFSAWPPEIDLFEGYSGKMGDYNKLSELTTTVHWSSPIKSHNYTRTEKHPTGLKRFNLAVTILRDKLNFYYQGHLVRVIDDPEIMSNIWNDPRQMVILNHAYTKEVIGNYAGIGSDFIIHKFLYNEIR